MNPMLKLFAFFYAIACATNDGSAYLETEHTYCASGFSQVCATGEYSQDAEHRVCCNSTTTSCVVVDGPWGCPLSYWHVCDIDAEMACATDDLSHVYIEDGPACDPGYSFACWEDQFGESTWSVCCDGGQCEAIWNGAPCDGEVFCDAAPAP